MVEVRPGIAGAKLSRNLVDITLLDVYQAVNAVEEDSLFSVHDAPNPQCPVGRNIQASIGPLFSIVQKAMEEALSNVKLVDIVNDIQVKERHDREVNSDAHSFAKVWALFILRGNVGMVS